MQFFNRTRTALARYGEGVHDLGVPATEKNLLTVEQRLGRALPASYREFLLQWNGGWLFHDDYALFGAPGTTPTLDRIAQNEALLHVGESPDADLFLDDKGRVLVRDAETESRRIEGSDFERWLDATLLREGVLYDRDGEFRDEAFDGSELSEAARRKRALLGVKADPNSPAFREELGLLFLDEDQADKALVELHRAVSLEPSLSSAWSAIARTERKRKRYAGAMEAFVRAAENEPLADEQAFAWAQAARAAGDAGAPVLVEKAAEFAKRVEQLAPGFVEQQRVAAAHLEAEGDFEGGIERVALAVAVRPDEALRSLLGRLRSRIALRITTS